MQALRVLYDLTRWKRHGVMALAGALATLAFPPFYLLPCLVASLSLLALMAWKSRSPQEAFLTGWWFGFGHFVTGLYWTSISLLVEPEKFAWLIPFAVSLIPAVLACYIGIWAWALWVLPANAAGKRVAVAACGWVFLEMLRGYLFSGFPWNLAGYAWNIAPQIMQFASVMGVYGLSFLTLWLAVALAAMLNGESRRPLILCCAALLAIAAWGEWRLRGENGPDVEGVRLRLVQPNIAQTDKWLPESRARQWERLVRQSTLPAEPAPTHVIWPETALPMLWSDVQRLPEPARAAVPEKGALLAGVVRVEEGAPDRYYNSLIAVDGDGEGVAAYDKAHLVPFGEYVPFRSVLPLERIAHGMADFSEGEPGALLEGIPGLPAAIAQICYEGIFPAPVKPFHADAEGLLKPRWIVNLTNDAWFGRSTGPYQHFEMTRLRAVEAGMPVVRVANTGISGIVDAYGRIRARTRLGEETILDGDLPPALAAPTLYAQFGNHLLTLILGVAALWGLAQGEARRQGR